MKVSKFLKVKRTKLLLTQEEMAKLLEMKQCQYSQLENGKTNPSVKTIRKIINNLKLTEEEINKLN